ncbi:MAG: ABC-F family ATP-binding cassette domain-containing protein [Firmicutes bacterium]|nr:ABC-F family ATP-binding cassette domain-containing protein [Bacillota bacterium]
MFEINDLSILVDTRYLVKSLSLTLNKNDKLAIIGEEGNGKSTLLKAILGVCDYAKIEGIINLYGNCVGYLKQSLDSFELSLKVFDYLFLDKNDYYEKINSLYKYLDMFLFDDSILEQYMYTLSGGEKVKVSILKILLSEADILFLDEPTNDLDIDTLLWLENFINSTSKPIVYVSHDEVLLSKTANMILHLEQIKNKTECRHTLLKIDYDTYVDKRLKSISKQIQMAKSDKRDFRKRQAKLFQVMQIVEHKQNVISRSKPFEAAILKRKMHTLKHQENKLNNMEMTEFPDVEENINFYFEKSSLPNSKVILKLDNYDLYIGDKLLAKNINMEVIGNSHICIIGSNGCGKSTLIKQIYSFLNNRDDIRVGYMPQNYDDVLEKYEYVLDFICDSKKKEDITKSRMYLGNMKFTKEEMSGKISNLSNGSKAKLFLIKLVLDQVNVLILDEPTRNVSPLSNPVIRSVLRDFSGCIISVSHDRKYIEEVIDSLYILNKDGLKKEY